MKKESQLKIAGVALILGILFDYFFYGKEPGLSFPVYVALTVLGLFVLVGALGKRITKQAMWLLLPLAFFSSMFFVRASMQLNFMNFIASMLILLIIARIAFDAALPDFVLWDYIKAIFLPLRFVPELFASLGRIFAAREGERRKISPQVVRGIVITIPVLIIFALLFSSADLIFQKYFIALFHFKISPRLVSRLVLIAAASLGLLASYSYVLKDKPGEPVGHSPSQTKVLGIVESSILLACVNALFLVFIALQIAYLFGGQSNISAQGFTYADYARKGFFELIAVAVFSFLLILGVEKTIARKEGGHTLLFKSLGGLLILQVIVVMASAFKRLLLYEKAYGFTMPRFYSHAFILLLAGIFILLLWKIYMDGRENRFALGVFVCLVAFLAILNLTNPDAFIARRNIERFRETGKLDQDYLLKGLSDDAAPEISKVITLPPRESRDAPWQSFNLSRQKAQNLR